MQPALDGERAEPVRHFNEDIPREQEADEVLV